MHTHARTHTHTHTHTHTRTHARMHAHTHTLDYLQMTTISAHNENIDQVVLTLSNELQHSIKWCENNHIAINISKTKCM